MSHKTILRAVVSVVAVGAALIIISPSPGRAAAQSPGKKAIARHQTHRGRSVPAHFEKGGVLYRHKPSFAPPDHDQDGGRKIPIGPFHPRPKSPPVSIHPIPADGARAGHPARPRGFITQTDTQNAVKACSPAACWPAEPNEASDGKIVVYTTNTYVGFSVNGGTSFASFTPGSLYSDDPNGGPCCDQIVQYAPSINRFIWILQYNAGGNGYDRYRLAVFPPSSVTAHGLTSWVTWDITTGDFPGIAYHWLDFPDLALGSKYLYLSCDFGVASTDTIDGSVIARISLASLAAGANLAAGPAAWRFITGSPLFGRVAQNTGSTAYWALPLSTSQMNVSYWPESGTLAYGPATVSIDSWPDANFTSKTPDGDSWNSAYKNVVLAAAVTPAVNGKPRTLWLAWPGGRGTGTLAWLTQPHVELAAISVPGLAFESQQAIWSGTAALAYASLAVDSQGQLGLTVALGGGKSWVNSAVGNLSVSSTALFSYTSSTTSDRHNRWGDYMDIRPAYGVKGAQFTAAGYGTDAATATRGKEYDPVFAAFAETP